MARLASEERLTEAAADLRAAAERLAIDGRQLGRQVHEMAWRGYGADRFRRRAAERLNELARVRRVVRQLARELDRAAADVHAEARDLDRIERAYEQLVRAGVVRRRPDAPPHRDTRWREFISTVTAVPA